MTAQFINFAYLIAAVCFIMALRGLASPETARRGNITGIVGMVIAIVTTLASSAVLSYELIAVGIIVGGAVGTVTALKIKMTALPQLIAAFHSLVGLAAVCIAAAAFHAPEAYGIAVDGVLTAATLVELAIGTGVGALTFSGSIVAFAKLQGLISGAPVRFTGQHALNALLGLSLAATVGWFCLGGGASAFWPIVALSLALGLLIIIPIGGADMPVVISMLNSYSGWAACGIGFTLANPLLIITGALVGSSGAILSYIMCKSMNRSFLSVILGGIGANADADPAATRQQGDRPVKVGSAEDAAFVMKNASKVIIVPGYGMAVAQAQHALREMGDLLKSAGVEVCYAIHPVAGRMPGHMNVLLAEAEIDYECLLDMDQVNPMFAQTDVTIVIGANDVVNPLARTDPDSPIAGMPVLNVDDSRTVVVIKRSLGAGFAGIPNPLFAADGTLMLFGDGKKAVLDIVAALLNA